MTDHNKILERNANRLIIIGNKENHHPEKAFRSIFSNSIYEGREQYDLVMKFWNHTMKCPCCGKYLVSIGKSIISEILTFGSPIYNIDHLNLVCRNNDCEGWVCDYCETWHPYNTTCSVAMVRNTRNGVDHPESYSEWMAWEGK